MGLNKGEKQTYNQERYIRRLKERKEEYKKRLEFVADFKLPSDEPEEYVDEEQGTGNAVEEPAGGIGNFVGSGQLVVPAEHKTYRYTSGFGWRWGRQHYGVDLAPNTPGASGCKILAAGDGTVIRAGATGGFGQVIVIKHKDDLYTLYGHMPASTIGVKVGDIVRQGQHIADMGKEGDSTGVHLHFEIHTNYEKRYKGGGTIDPETMLDFKSGSSNHSSASSVKNQMRMAASVTEEVADGTGPMMHAEYSDEQSAFTKEEWEADKMYRTTFPYRPMKVENTGLRFDSRSREAFLVERIGWARTTKYELMASLNKKRFIHQSHYDGYEGNLYSPDAKRLFESLLLKTKKPYFEIISGFRISEAGQLSPHEAGCAMDILVKDYEEVREIADCAWQLGFRSIAIGGSFEEKKGFIHLDIAPKGNDFKYDGVPIYGGPGKWEMK